MDRVPIDVASRALVQLLEQRVAKMQSWGELSLPDAHSVVDVLRSEPKSSINTLIADDSLRSNSTCVNGIVEAIDMVVGDPDTSLEEWSPDGLENVLRSKLLLDPSGRTDVRNAPVVPSLELELTRRWIRDPKLATTEPDSLAWNVLENVLYRRVGLSQPDARLAPQIRNARRGLVNYLNEDDRASDGLLQLLIRMTGSEDGARDAIDRTRARSRRHNPATTEPHDVATAAVRSVARGTLRNWRKSALASSDGQPRRHGSFALVQAAVDARGSIAQIIPPHLIPNLVRDLEEAVDVPLDILVDYPDSYPLSSEDLEPYDSLIRSLRGDTPNTFSNGLFGDETVSTSLE